MRSGNRFAAAGAAGLCLAAATMGRAGMQEWVQHLPAGGLLDEFFRTVAMPGGEVKARRPPAETRDTLTKTIGAHPRDAALYRLRASEAELAEDYTAAEADWKRYAELASDSAEAHLELAGFYHRRLRSREEIGALMVVTRDKSDAPTPVERQRAWQAFESILSVVEGDGLPSTEGLQALRAWVARYPQERSVHQRFIRALASDGRFAEADKETAIYARLFHDEVDAVRLRAEIELSRGNAEAALRIYDASFEPGWQDDMTKSWFELLEREGKLREFAGRARAALEANPADLRAAAGLFHYFRFQNNAPAAGRTLLEYRLAKESGKHPWRAGELAAMAQLFERLPGVNDAARLWYALYSVPGGADADRERALYGLANLLLTQADQPVQFGSGDLSFYKDVATIDPSPGFLNGILSLVLNGTGPQWAWREQNGKAAPYFHRAAASRLTALLEQRFPRSRYRETLRAGLVQAYATYGDGAAVIQAGQTYLAAFPDGSHRFATAMTMADALARENRVAEEFALYERLLRDLAARAGGVPLGNAEVSPEYVQALDRYLSRLAALKRPMDALRVYRAEIDRNPHDPGLYERLAAFLERNDMAAEVEQTYRLAIARFPDRSWYHKLARWYLRRRQNEAFEKIGREAAGIFSGTELETYIADVANAAAGERPVLYRQVNLYAHERFPQDLVFVRNLILAYSQPATFDPNAIERLYRSYWFYDDSLRAGFFRFLAENGRIYAELGAVRKANPDALAGRADPKAPANFAAAQFAAEAEIWLSHFEAAAPPMKTLAETWPADQAFTGRASAIYRSLAAYFPEDTGVAARFAEAGYRSDARNRDRLARVGDIYADRGQFGRARPVWNRMTQVEAGHPEAWLDAATVFWDYYLFDDAFRVIAGARERFKNPALFAYQAGAISENRRAYESAVRQYVAGALAGDAQCVRRLGALSIRAQTRDVVDKATVQAAQGNAAWPAVSLRISILERQRRREELEALLNSQINAQTAQATLEQIAAVAQERGFDGLQARTFARQIEVTNDPVERMRLTLALVRLDESRKDIAAAARTADALWRGHPEILGVIRGAVDFHVRNKQPAEAIAILLDAAKRARTDLGRQFTFEAARIATEAGGFAQARELVTTLLAADPYNEAYLAAMAETFLRANEDGRYRDFLTGMIAALGKSPLSPPEKNGRIAALRRTLIPALTRMGDFAGAVEQYIEIIDSFPEDESLAREAASYAMAHTRAVQLVGFYRKAVADAPRDYRWPIALARIETALEDYPAAIEAYDRAMKDRPDRSDIVERRAGLEERLMRFGDAERSYLRLYELTYHAPEWLEKVAEARARLGRRTEAVDALKTAVQGAHAETAEADFHIAERLEEWHMAGDAVRFAERGAELAGAELFTAPRFGQARIYARIMAEARRFDAVLKRIDPATKDRADVSKAVGDVIAGLYTPEEKAGFEEALSAKAAGMDRMHRDAVLLPFAMSAGLASLEARWRFDTMMEGGERVDERFVALETGRANYRELGRELEQFAARVPENWTSALHQATTAWIEEGDIDAQLRTMGKLEGGNALGGETFERYLSLLAALRPEELVRLAAAGSSTDTRNRAVESAIGSGNRPLAYRTVKIRGAKLKPVWTKAYTALAGVYFADASANVKAAFTDALDTRTIGERISAPPDPAAALVGPFWFYYGARYGEYLEGQRSAKAGDYLPAGTEGAPGSAGAYLALGDFYAAERHTEKAIAQYGLALQLDPDRGDAYGHMARTEWAAGRRDAAMRDWRAAIAALLRVQSRGDRLERSFRWRASETFHDIGESRAMAGLKGDIERLLLDYIGRNGTFELEPLMSAAVTASIASGEDPVWVLELVGKAEGGEYIADRLLQNPDLTDAQRIAMDRTRIAIFERKLQGLYGDARTQQEAALTSARLHLISRLLDDGMGERAKEEWKLLPEAVREGSAPRDGLAGIVEIRLAVQIATLDTLLERYRSKPETAPGIEDLRTAAQALRVEGREAGALAVLDFLYTRELDGGHMEAANFLGLAEVRLEQKNSGAALRLLHRMALVTDNPFDTLPPAADLLEKYGLDAEAGEFISLRLRAVPWDGAAKLHAARLAKGAKRHDGLSQVIADPLAVYADRAQAARLLAGAAPAPLAGTELGLLAAGRVTPPAAEKPFYVEGRLQAAGGAADPDTRLRLFREALAIAPLDPRARMGAVRAALTARRDRTALSLAETDENGVANILPSAGLSGADGAVLAGQLAAAAERLDELPIAENYLRIAIQALPRNESALDKTRLASIEAERKRRAGNAARQPVVRNTVEQDRVVLPEIPRSAR